MSPTPRMQLPSRLQMAIKVSQDLETLIALPGCYESVP